MRRPLVLLAALALALVGCRVPPIPGQPSHREYAVYGAWLEQASSTLPPQLTFVVEAETLALNQNELQFQQCLPRRMETVFSGITAATLVSTSGNDWLRIADNRPAVLHPTGTPFEFDHPIEWIRLSRVAFTRSGYDAYLWVEHRSCGLEGKGCNEGTGALLHGKKSDGQWTFENTVCETSIPSFPGR